MIYPTELPSQGGKSYFLFYLNQAKISNSFPFVNNKIPLTTIKSDIMVQRYLPCKDTNQMLLWFVIYYFLIKYYRIKNILLKHTVVMRQSNTVACSFITHCKVFGFGILCFTDWNVICFSTAVGLPASEHPQVIGSDCCTVLYWAVWDSKDLSGYYYSR